MMDDDECECGDYRGQHEKDGGKCLACRGSSYVPGPNDIGPCQKFVLYLSVHTDVPIRTEPDGPAGMSNTMS
jgi:hypothetical protein